MDSSFRVVLDHAISFDSEMHPEIENTKAIALVFCQFLAILKGAYFRLIRADLDRRVSPLDSPFRVVLDRAISFDSETHSKNRKHQGYSLGVLANFWPF